MLRSLRALPQTEGAHPASVDKLLTRIIGFTGEFDLYLKKVTAQYVKDMIRSEPEIMSPERAQDLARKSTPESELTAEPTVNNKRFPTIKQRKCKRSTRRDPTESINRISCNTKSRQTVTKRNIIQKCTQQSQRSIPPTHKRADESENDDFLDEIIPGLTMPHLSPHKSDIETTQ
ncbi:MAG: hypothetical protein EZS28_020738 [Streblomastix strix]|uniref:Uncharacterized protein n=1 Tax=Streblomastix strix TaxID=222440 RepID=A0A5J4VMK2_9EUKA|nr:MAG: hypothetical protein EZS28_020738 [Streblomastix strix]